MDAITIEEMNKRKMWLRWGIYIIGAGFVVSLFTTGILKAVIAGWIVLSPALWLGVWVGVVFAGLCLVAGIGLFVRGLMVKAK